MEMLRQRVPLWSPSANTAPARVARATEGAVRILTPGDTPALQRLIGREPVANVSVAASLQARGDAGPGRGRNGPLVLAIDGGTPTVGSQHEPAELAAACWVGSNINPVGASPAQAELFGLALRALRRRVSSIYGEAEAVLELYDSAGWTHHREIRPEQPLMSITGPPAVKPLHGVRPSRSDEFGEVEPACAAMFTEELGVSPYSQGASQYRERIRSLIQAGHSLIHRDPGTGEIVFKAEFGAVTREVVQIQGVWVHPGHRGRGLAAPGMAAVVLHGLKLAPTVSLYVNSYNTPALRTYQRVGFERAGTFATVLF